MKPFSTPPRSILISSIRLIGDVILTTPLIKIFKDAWPQTPVDVLVNVKTGEFLKKDPRVRRIIASHAWDVDTNQRTSGKSYFWEIAKRYDLAVNMSASDRGTFAALAGGKRCKVGFFEARRPVKELWKKLLLTHPIPYDHDCHRACLCAYVARALGLPHERLEANVFWDEADRSAVSQLLNNESVETGYFVVHPFARWRYKFWDMNKVVETSDLISAQYGLRPVWTCAPIPEEQEVLVREASRCRIPPITVPGTLTLNRMACLIDGAELYLGVDTAISHIAATTGVPMVALFGPTPSNLWAPWNNVLPADDQCRRGIMDDCSSGNIVVLQKKPECFPCFRMGCEDKTRESRCLTAITIEEVMSAIGRLL